jgi:high-affinity iron transporter
MLGALIIVFREVFEAGLIVGIVLAVTRGIAGRDRWIGLGIAGGVVGACVVAAFAGALSQLFEGVGQELFNATILGIAVIMLTWHNVWMGRHGGELAAEARAVGQSVADGARSLLALAVVVGVAVMREGSEVALFLYGIVAAGGGSGASIAVGGVIGLVLGALVCLLTYLGLVRIPAKPLFRVTTVLIALLAAGMAAQATAFLAQANWVTAFGNVVWDTSWLVSDESMLGKALHTLIGYTDQPTGMQLIVYVATLGVTFAAIRLASPAANRGSNGRPAPAE